MARVLSIQSHVVSGYVGNRSATFPLQLLGIEVDVINSVQFSNHTGYPSWTGEKLTADQLWALFEGLQANNLANYSHLLTGYVGSAEFLYVIVKIANAMKKVNPDMVFVCDPVLGDHGKLYVPADLVPIYRDQVLPLADIVTPNQFEAQILTDVTVESLEDASRASKVLHSRGSKTVVVSSLDIPNNDNIHVFSSAFDGGETYTQAYLTVPRIDFPFTGTGDLLSALLLAWTREHSVAKALAMTVSTVQAVLKRTVEAAKNSPDSVKMRELRLIQSKKDIENPPTLQAAKTFPQKET